MKKELEYLLLRSNISNYQISKATGIGQNVLSKYSNRISDIGNMSLDYALLLHNYFKEMLKSMDNKFGTVTFEGKDYILLDQAELSGRQLLDWQIAEGYVHFTAPALDQDGNQFQVEWVLKTVHENGEAIEDLGDLEWNKANKVVNQ